MVLTLVRSSGEKNEKELVPFAKSYQVSSYCTYSFHRMTSQHDAIQEAVQTAMIAFHEHLPDEVDAKDITLKYQVRGAETSPSWAGLTMARESAVSA